MTLRRFPVIVPRSLRLDHELRDGVPAIVLSIPWALLAPHEARVQADWGHSLDFLATDRGGLMAHELVAILEVRDVRLMPRAESNARLLELMARMEVA